MMDKKLDARLQEIRGRISQVDPLLVFLVNLTARSKISIQMGIVLVVGNTTVSGILGSSASTGERLDADAIWYFRVMEAAERKSGNGEGWENVISEFKRWAPFESAGKREDEARNEITDRIGDQQYKDISDLDEDLIEDAVDAFLPPKAVTISSAQVKVGGERQWQAVGNVRVNLSEVSVWWPDRLNPPEDLREFLSKVED